MSSDELDTEFKSQEIRGGRAASSGELSDSPGEPRSVVVPSEPLFRTAALEARAEDRPEEPVLRVAPPWGVAITLLLSSFVFACAVLAAIGDVDVTAQGRGVLRVRGGIHRISAQVPGIVVHVAAHSGDAVRTGDVIASLDAPPVRARLHEASERLSAAKSKLEQLEERQKELYKGRLARMRERGQLALEAELESDLWNARAAVREAAAERDGAALTLEQLKVIAPCDGRMEAVLVRPGDALAAGAPIGKLVPADGVLEVVSFVPERERAFLEPGHAGRVELDQLPVSEFGAVSATIRRIANDIASADEVRDAFGEAATMDDAAFRVELTLNDDAQTRKLSKYLRNGSMLSVRVPVRKRRAIGVLFEPLQHLFR